MGPITALKPGTCTALGWAGAGGEAELLSQTLLLSRLALLSLLPGCWARDSSRPCSSQAGLGSRATIRAQTLHRVSDHRRRKQPFPITFSNLLKNTFMSPIFEDEKLLLGLVGRFFFSCSQVSLWEWRNEWGGLTLCSHEHHVSEDKDHLCQRIGGFVLPVCLGKEHHRKKKREGGKKNKRED